MEFGNLEVLLDSFFTLLDQVLGSTTFPLLLLISFCLPGPGQVDWVMYTRFNSSLPLVVLWEMAGNLSRTNHEQKLHRTQITQHIFRKQGLDQGFSERTSRLGRTPHPLFIDVFGRSRN